MVPQVGTECLHLSVPCGEALLILVNIHISARNTWVSISRHLCFRMSWISSVPGTFTILLVWSKHKLCREKKTVYLKSAKEQHFFMPQQLLKFSISFFPYYLRKKFLTSYLSFWLMLRTVLTFAQIRSKFKFFSLVVSSILRFTYLKVFSPHITFFVTLFPSSQSVWWEPPETLSNVSLLNNLRSTTADGTSSYKYASLRWGNWYQPHACISSFFKANIHLLSTVTT